MSYKIGKKEYTLRFSIGRLEAIEAATGEGVMSMVMGTQSGKMPPLATLRAYFAHGLYDGESYAAISDGRKCAEEELEAHGYAVMFSAVIEALTRDCGFLFQGG